MAQASKSWLPKLFLLAGSLAVAAVVAEVLLRRVFHAAPLLDVDIYYLDAAGNLRMRPGIRRRHVTRLWDVTIDINQEGFRDRVRPVTSQVAPILGLGDSFAFGWGVNLENTYLYLLEESLARVQPIRVVKAGTPGTGPGDQFRLLEAVWDRYRPQLVILSFFVGNDFTDVQMGGVEQFDVKDGLLLRRELRPGPWQDSLRQKLARSSHLLQFMRAVQLDWQRRRAASFSAPHTALAARDPWLAEFAKIHLREYPPETARAVRQTLECLDRFQSFCTQHQAGFVLMVIPRSIQVYPEELQEWRSAFQIPDQDVDADHPQRVLHDWAAGRGALLLDLLPAFRQYRSEHPGEKLYYYPDAHFNPAGHRLTAALLADFLERQNLPRFSGGK